MDVRKIYVCFTNESDLPSGLTADISEIQPLTGSKQPVGILQNTSRPRTPNPLPVSSSDDHHQSINQQTQSTTSASGQQKFNRSPCDHCGFHNFPIMSNATPLPIPSAAAPRSHKSLETVEQNNTSLSSVPNNMLIPHHSNMRRNDSNYSIGMPVQELAVSRRPSLLLQEILTTRRPSLILGRRDNSYKTPKTMRLLQEHRNNCGSILSINGGPNGSMGDCERGPKSALAKNSKFKNRRVGDDAISSSLSALYCKILVLIGVCLPITEIISQQVPTYVYQGFYVYLYSLSVLFVFFLYICAFRHRAIFNVLKDYHEKNNNIHLKRKAVRFGSFYLRIGAIAFAIGNMVYSGLELGQFFELNGRPGCQDPFLAITPIARISLCIIQVQFIFLNTTYLDMARHKVICRFGLMHMVATNLCEWLYVLVEETKHEIFHVASHEHDHNGKVLQNNAPHEMVNNLTVVGTANLTSTTSTTQRTGCSRTNIMGALVQEVSPFLFPCTIEYSLICAVILYEMWKTVRSIPDIAKTRKDSIMPTTERQSSQHQFSIDCSQSHKGLFVGILVIVMTIISIIMYFVLYTQPGYELIATKEVTLWETCIYAISAVAIITGIFLMRDLKYVASDGHHHSMKLDLTLLIVAQTGVYLYGMFSMMGSYFSKWDTVPDRVEGIVAEICNLFQTSLQTMFIIHTVHRRCKGSKQQRQKPGREVITYLLVANMAIWFINTLIKGRAMFRQTHLDFFGVWGWTIITHVSMPLAIFYRFHSTICLFEVWKTTYKAKSH
ncbi:proton channel OtopLc isoform X2 [Eupeodes corollae]|uniref:proton channel OtopLc isoform X2 n=1 Tax=Eupeodes corollae TaxID=290404 RepID=UPI0024915D22|nr:proton channel OtopLc isoform X2 [Eupeodes corollae]